jgi:hypothetical protein
MEIKQSYVKAYELGKKLNDVYRDIRDAYCDNRVENIIGWDFSGVEALFFKAGYRNADMPIWVSGWRYGEIPECGFSMNYRLEYLLYKLDDNMTLSREEARELKELMEVEQ